MYQNFSIHFHLMSYQLQENPQERLLKLGQLFKKGSMWCLWSDPAGLWAGICHSDSSSNIYFSYIDSTALKICHENICLALCKIYIATPKFLSLVWLDLECAHRPAHMTHDCGKQ